MRHAVRLRPEEERRVALGVLTPNAALIDGRGRKSSRLWRHCRDCCTRAAMRRAAIRRVPLLPWFPKYSLSLLRADLPVCPARIGTVNPVGWAFAPRVRDAHAGLPAMRADCGCGFASRILWRSAIISAEAGGATLRRCQQAVPTGARAADRAGAPVLRARHRYGLLQLWVVSET